VIIVAIDSPASVTRFTVEAFYQWHFANAFDRGGEIVVDLVRYPDFTSMGWLDTVFAGRVPAEAGSRLLRGIVDRTTRSLRWEHLADAPCEFPRVVPGTEGRVHRFVYLCGLARDARQSSVPIESVIAVDTATLVSSTWSAPGGQIPSEPLFVPRVRPRGENDGWLLTLVRDVRSGGSHLAVLDAARLADGPVARVWFDQPLPLTLHGVWVPDR
jgi:all-trans-8'-apo-beta-carotenal 15,15'-oxygenase